MKLRIQSIEPWSPAPGQEAWLAVATAEDGDNLLSAVASADTPVRSAEVAMRDAASLLRRCLVTERLQSPVEAEEEEAQGELDAALTVAIRTDPDPDEEVDDDAEGASVQAQPPPTATGGVTLEEARARLRGVLKKHGFPLTGDWHTGPLRFLHVNDYIMGEAWDLVEGKRPAEWSVAAIEMVCEALEAYCSDGHRPPLPGQVPPSRSKPA